MKLPHLALWTAILLAAGSASAEKPERQNYFEGRRRWVWLKGCVARSEQVLAVEQLVRNIDDVEAVINQLTLISR